LKKARTKLGNASAFAVARGEQPFPPKARLARALGASAMGVIMRLSSFLLLCIGVQILWNGASALLANLPTIAHSAAR